MYIGIDVGTSGVKVIIAGGQDKILASARQGLQVSRPRLHWCEQHPDLWWDAVVACFDELRADHPDLLAKTRGIGLSGQMLGSVLIGRDNRPIRPAILWNDGRAVTEAQAMIDAMPDIGVRAGCNPHPGFVAPKIMWLKRHEPEIIDRVDCLLLPKDYIRLKLTGERATEPTDACGTHFMESRLGQWALDLIQLAGADPKWLAPVHSAWEAGGCLLPELARRWGLPPDTGVALGAGDNMTESIGVGAGRPGDAIISVGTSAVICIVDAKYNPIPEISVFTHPHAVPGTYLSMGVVLSATSCLDWAASLTRQSPADLVAAAGEVLQSGRVRNAPIMLPYMSGIRTPHDLPNARGLMLGMDLDTDAAMLGWSVLEGVAFHIAEALQAQLKAGIAVKHLQFIGGGSRSRLWGEMIASLTGIPMDLPLGREVGSAQGAARLAQVACGDGEVVETLCKRPPVQNRIEPLPDLKPLLKERFAKFRQVFRQNRAHL